MLNFIKGLFKRNKKQTPVLQPDELEVKMTSWYPSKPPAEPRKPRSKPVTQAPRDWRAEVDEWRKNCRQVDRYFAMMAA